MALAPLAYVLYRRVHAAQPGQPELGEPRPVHPLGRPRLRSSSTPTLHLTGYNLSLEELKRFRQWESRTPGHPEHFVTEGVETTTGPLGQGFANGVGFAIADRFLAERYNRPHHEIVDRFVYAICSDGDLMEGVSYEAASIAGHLGLGRLVYFYDDNHITIDGTTSLTFTTEDKAKRFEAQGWHVQSIADSEDVDAIERATRAAQAVRGRAVADHRPQPHRLRGAEGGRHGQVARRAARRGGGRGDEAGARARSRTSTSTSRPRSTSTWTCARRGSSSRSRSGSSGFERWAETFPAAEGGVGRRSHRQAAAGLDRGAAGVPGRRGGRQPRRRQDGDAGAEALHADDGRRRRGSRRVDEDRVRGRRALLEGSTPAGTSPSASASTRWARS